VATAFAACCDVNAGSSRFVKAMVMMDKNVDEPRSAKRLRTESPRRDDVDGAEHLPAGGDRAGKYGADAALRAAYFLQT